MPKNKKMWFNNLMNYQITWQTGSSAPHQVTITPSAATSTNTIQIGAHSYSVMGAKEDIAFILNTIGRNRFSSPEELQTALSPLSAHQFQKISGEQRIIEASGLPRLKTQDLLPPKFKEYLKDVVHHPAFSGVIAISWGDREPMTLIAKGREAFTADTSFNILSVGKAFTATAIMQLVEKGAISLETPLADIDLSDDAFHLKDGDPKYRQDLCPDSTFKTEVETAIQSFRQNRDITIGHLLRHQAGLLDDMESKGLRFATSEIGKFHYSNYGYQILARIIAKKSGMPFTKYISDHIFEPSGAKSEAVRPAGPEPKPHRSVMGQLEPLAEEKIRVPDADGNGCWWMRAADLEMVIKAFNQGQFFQQKETLAKLITPIEKPKIEELTIAKGAGLLIAPDESRPAIIFQGSFGGRSAVALSISGGDAPLTMAAVLNCPDGGNFWADLVEIYRGKTISAPLEKFAHFSARREASKELFHKLSVDPPQSKEAMMQLLKEYAKREIASEYLAISEKLANPATATLMREADQELRRLAQ